MADIVSAIDEEIRDLEESLAADPRHQKLKALRELRDLYTATPTAENVSQAAGPRLVLPRKLILRRKPDPSREELLTAVHGILDMLGPQPLKTSDIYEILNEETRAKIGGVDPRNNLSAILHNSGRFRSHGRRGWSLPSEVPDGDDEPVLGPPEDVEDVV